MAEGSSVQAAPRGLSEQDVREWPLKGGAALPSGLAVKEGKEGRCPMSGIKKTLLLVLSFCVTLF